MAAEKKIPAIISTNAVALTETPKRDRLQSLPPELRLAIYQNFMPDAVADASKPGVKHIPAILETSRLLRTETLKLWRKYIEEKVNERHSTIAALRLDQDNGMRSKAKVYNEDSCCSICDITEEMKDAENEIDKLGDMAKIAESAIKGSDVWSDKVAILLRFRQGLLVGKWVSEAELD